MTLSFENEVDANLAKEALWIEKFCPELFKLFPDFRKYDPTIALPRETRERAIRLCPKNIIDNDPEGSDVTSVISSLYSDTSPDLKGSMIGTIYASPLTHIIRIYYFLQFAPKVASIQISHDDQKIVVDFDKKGAGFWFEGHPNEIQLSDLKESLSKGLYLGLAFPITVSAYENFLDGELHHHMERIPDDFYKKNTINDLFLMHIQNNKVTRRSWDYSSKLATPPKSSKAVSAEHWLSAA